MQKTTIVTTAIVSFAFGFFLCCLLALMQPWIFMPVPWKVAGENRGQFVKRIERQLNQTAGKGEWLSYEIYSTKEVGNKTWWRNRKRYVIEEYSR